MNVGLCKKQNKNTWTQSYDTLMCKIANESGRAINERNETWNNYHSSLKY